jgi:hypothetical protein
VFPEDLDLPLDKAQAASLPLSLSHALNLSNTHTLALSLLHTLSHTHSLSLSLSDSSTLFLDKARVSERAEDPGFRVEDFRIENYGSEARG